MANELHTFTGNEVIATELPELLNQNFDYVRENSLKSVNGIAKDENNNVDVTFLTRQVIPTNSDLNNFRESGEYTRELDTIVVANSPTEKPFFLTVLASENLVKQVVTEIDRKDPMTFTRTLSGANWSPWVEGGVDIGIWKSEETVKVGDVRFLKGRENAGYILECVTAGTTGENQPVISEEDVENVKGLDINDLNGVVPIDKGGIGATKLIRKKNASYDVGDVVYNETNGKVALKCVTDGTTSAEELDISGKAVGENVEDGSVVWKVVKRDLSEEVRANADNFANHLAIDGSKAMSAPINTNAIIGMRKQTNAESLEFDGGKDYTQGAYLVLYGAESTNAGEFNLATSKNGVYYRLRGYPDGLLTWGGNSVITTNEIQQGRGVDYYLEAYQMRSVQITYKKPLKTIVYPKVWLAGNRDVRYGAIALRATNVTTTGFTLRIDNSNEAGSYYVDFYWEVIGEVAV